MKAVNPDATFQDIVDLYLANSIEDIESRRDAQEAAAAEAAASPATTVAE